MSEAGLGVITVLILLVICTILSFFALILKDRYLQTKMVQKPQKSQQKVYFIEPAKKKRKPKNKNLTIPINATILKEEDLKKLLQKK